MLVHVREVGVFGGLATCEAGNKADRCTRDGARSAESVSIGEECRVFRQFAVQGSLKHKVPYRSQGGPTLIGVGLPRLSRRGGPRFE